MKYSNKNGINFNNKISNYQFNTINGDQIFHLKNSNEKKKIIRVYKKWTVGANLSGLQVSCLYLCNYFFLCCVSKK